MHRATALLIVLTLGLAFLPAPLSERAEARAPEALQFTQRIDDATSVTYVLEHDLVLLAPNATVGDKLILLESKLLHLRTCYPCEQTTLPAYLPPETDGCLVGGAPRDEMKLCIEPRSTGVQHGVALARTTDTGAALLAWGGGCVIHERDGLPPQRVAFEGIALPTLVLTPGGSCD